VIVVLCFDIRPGGVRGGGRCQAVEHSRCEGTRACLAYLYIRPSGALLAPEGRRIFGGL
jgi:hypothetical protein